MPANGRYNRQGLNQSRQLLAPIQVAPPKSTITPTRYISRRSSETASEAPNTASAREHSKAERTQPEFLSTARRRSQFHNCPLDKDACPSPFGFEIFKIRIDFAHLFSVSLQSLAVISSQEQRKRATKDYVTTDNGLHASGTSRASYLLVCGDAVLVGRWNIVDGPVRCAAFF